MRNDERDGYFVLGWFVFVAFLFVGMLVLFTWAVIELVTWVTAQ